MDEQNYYDEIYENVKSNFENYLYQSGLPENVLDNIVSKEKVKKDTEIIINNIYDGTNEVVEVNSIEENLTNNIKDALGGSIPSSQEKSIKQYISTICNEYKTVITSTKYESKIYDYKNKANHYISILKKTLLISIIGLCIIICLLTVKKLYFFLASLGVAQTVCGLMLVFLKYYVFKKVRIAGITILNEPISKVLRAILMQIFAEMIKYGYLFLTMGVLLIVVYGFTKSIIKKKKENEQYTPEN